MISGKLRIKSYKQDLNPSQRRVADYVLDNPEEVVYSSITVLAEKADVSEATVVKFCQNIGLSGFQELKIILAREDGEGAEKEDKIYGEIKPRDDTEEVKNKLFQLHQESLQNTGQLLEEEKIDLAAKSLLEAEGRYFFGYGASALVARDAELKFRRIALPAAAATDVHEQKMLSANLSEEDVTVAISNSGRTREILEVVNVLEEMDSKLIAITSQAGSPLAERADILLINFSQETPFRGGAMASRLAQLSIIDMLFLRTALYRYEDTNEALRRTREAIKSSKIDLY